MDLRIRVTCLACGSDFSLLNKSDHGTIHCPNCGRVVQHGARLEEILRIAREVSEEEFLFDPDVLR